MNNLVERLDEQARTIGDRVALADREGGARRSLTFGELHAASVAGARLLRSQGLVAGDAVLIFHPVKIELYVALLSVFRAGMTAMFVDPSAGRGLIRSACELHPPAAFFGSTKAQLLRLLVPAVAKIGVKFRTGPWVPGAVGWEVDALVADDADGAADDGPVDCEEGFPALVTFTSGSTGQPKAVGRSHRFLLAQHRALERTLELGGSSSVGNQVDLVTLPIFGLANLASGMTSVLADTDLAKPGEVDVAAVGRQMAEEGVTRVAASPAFFRCLLRSPEVLGGLRRIATGGAPVFPPLLSALAEAAPGAEVAGVYGSTEAEPIAELPLAEIEEDDLLAMREGAGLLAGVPVDEIDLAVVPDNWGEALAPMSAEEFPQTHCGPDEVGEIVVAGDHVLEGYLHGRGDSETKFEVGGRLWHRTGDAGRLDGRGRLWMMGRCAAKIEDERGVLYPFAVEAALSFVSGITRCAALGAGGRRMLVVELDPGGPGEEEIAQVVGWAEIDEIKVLPKIPVDRRHNAKIDYPALRRLVGA